MTPICFLQQTSSGLGGAELTVYGARSQIKQIASASDTRAFALRARQQNKWGGMEKVPLSPFSFIMHLFTLEMTWHSRWHLYQADVDAMTFHNSCFKKREVIKN